MISTYHEEKMNTINEVNQEETKPVVVCDYNVKMLGWS
jgi:hypothetical protein